MGKMSTDIFPNKTYRWPIGIGKLNIANYQRNKNQYYNDVSPHTSQNGYHQKNLQIINAKEDGQKQEPSYTVSGDVNWYSHSEGKFAGVRKHLTRGFLCAVLDLSGTLWPLLIPEYSGIKRRGMPFPGLRNPGISHYSNKYSLPFYEPNGKR